MNIESMDIPDIDIDLEFVDQLEFILNEDVTLCYNYGEDNWFASYIDGEGEEFEEAVDLSIDSMVLYNYELEKAEIDDILYAKDNIE